MATDMSTRDMTCSLIPKAQMRNSRSHCSAEHGWPFLQLLDFNGTCWICIWRKYNSGNDLRQGALRDRIRLICIDDIFCPSICGRLSDLTGFQSDVECLDGVIIVMRHVLRDFVIAENLY